MELCNLNNEELEIVQEIGTSKALHRAVLDTIEQERNLLEGGGSDNDDIVLF